MARKRRTKCTWRDDLAEWDKGRLSIREIERRLERHGLTEEEIERLLPSLHTMKGLDSERNPSIRAQVRRLPSGEVQIKVPLKRGENPMAKARELAKALGRKVVSVARAGGKVLNPQLQKYVGGYYRVGEFFIGKAHIPMPKGQAWGIYTREGQVVGRAGSLQSATKKVQGYIDRGVVIKNPASSKAYWQYPWSVVVDSGSVGITTALSRGFNTEDQARAYIQKLKARSLHLGRAIKLLHNTGTNAPGGVKVVSSKSY